MINCMFPLDINENQQRISWKWAENQLRISLKSADVSKYLPSFSHSRSIEAAFPPLKLSSPTEFAEFTDHFDWPKSNFDNSPLDGAGIVAWPLRFRGFKMIKAAPPPDSNSSLHSLFLKKDKLGQLGSIGSIWSILDQFLINSWSIHDQFVINSWSIRDQFVINSWSNCDQILINLWSICDQFVINSWSICDQFVINLWSIRDQFVINLWSICDQFVINKVWTSNS